MSRMNKNQKIWNKAKKTAKFQTKSKAISIALIKTNQKASRGIFWNSNEHFWETHFCQKSKEIDCKEAIWALKSMGITSAILLVEQQTNKPIFFIDDHINLTGKNPLIGENIDEIGKRFPDQSAVYSKKWMAQLPEIERKTGCAGILPKTKKYIELPPVFVFCAILANHANMKTIGIVSSCKNKNLIQKIAEKCP